jgi:hypothetical protein
MPPAWQRLGFKRAIGPLRWLRLRKQRVGGGGLDGHLTGFVE